MLARHACGNWTNLTVHSTWLSVDLKVFIGSTNTVSLLVLRAEDDNLILKRRIIVFKNVLFYVHKADHSVLFTGKGFLVLHVLSSYLVRSS